MNKVIGEFLSNQQPHPQLMARVVFQVKTYCRFVCSRKTFARSQRFRLSFHSSNRRELRQEWGLNNAVFLFFLNL